MGANNSKGDDNNNEVQNSESVILSDDHIFEIFGGIRSAAPLLELFLEFFCLFLLYCYEEVYRLHQVYR